MAVDAFSKWNLEPAILSDATLQRLNQFLPPMWSHGNPIDLLGDAGPEHYLQAVKVCLEAPELQGMVVMLSPQAMTDPTGVARILAAEITSRAKPLIAVWMGGVHVAEGVRILNEAGIPTFSTPEEAVDTFMEMYTYSRNLELLQETPPRLPDDLKVNAKQAGTFIEECFKRGADILTEIESKAILSAYGIPVNHTVAASTAAAAAKAAKTIGFPVVVKVHSPNISHKSDVDGVRAHLHTEADVMAAFEEITATVRAKQPEAKLFGVTVQTQVQKADLELILGSKRDPDFGPIILFGLGGVLTEAFRDTAVDLPPLNLLLARRLMERTQVYRLLQGFRNIQPANLSRIEEILVRLSQLVTDFPEIMELDINPLLISNGEPVAVDARIAIAPSPAPAPRHLIISPYPNQYESDWLLQDGTPVLLRPIRPEDEPLVAELLHNCSDETIYFRYFHLIKKWTHEMLIRFTQNDYDREIGLAAFGQPPGPEIMIGVGRLVMVPEHDRAEFAVIVADPWQGLGLGQKLIERVIEIARENGVKLLWGEVLAENQPMLEMVKKLGFTIKTDEREVATKRAEMHL
jgi:acetyltransferase